MGCLAISSSRLTFFICSICILLKTAISTITSPNRLRICSESGESKDVDDSFCQRGWWLPKPIDPVCICAGGTWLLSENYCDAKFYLLSGPDLDDQSGQEFLCFKVPSPIRRITSLTRHTTMYSQYFIEGDGEYMAQLDKLDFSPQPNSPITVIRLNAKTEMFMLHREGVQANTWQKCFGKRQNQPYTHIIRHDNTISYLKSLNEDEDCDDVKDPDFPYSKSNNTEWFINRVGSFGWSPDIGMLPLNPCTCPPPKGPSSKPLTPPTVKPYTGGKRKGRPVRPDERDRNTDPDYDSVPGDSFNIYPNKRDPLLHSEHLNDNKRTTASILSKLKDYILFGIKPPPFNNPLFEYIRFGKKILTKMCPEINPRIVGNLIGLFRLLLGDIIGRYPEEYSLNMDTGVHRRVIQALGNCYKGISNSTVKFQWGRNEEENVDCSERNIITGVEMNGKKLPLVIEGGNGGVPKRLKFMNGDVMLEVAWKVLMGAHYACSDYFADFPEDLSFMYVKGQEFLTIPYVMFRWENPTRGLTDAYKILNQDLNAHILGEQIDACVFAAFDSSSFNTWLGRPESEKEFIPHTVMKNAKDKLAGRSEFSMFDKNYSFKKNRHAGRILDGKGAFCVSDFNDPIKWSQVDQAFTEVTGCGTNNDA